MFDKFTTFKISRDDIEVLDNEMVKTASEFILPEGHQYDPDFLYLKVRAVSAGEYWGPNKNADFFPEEELKKSYKTFLQAHAFKNHENKDVAKAIGDVLQAIWNDSMKYVELLIRIDRKVAPTIVRGFEKGFMTDVSMGCKIKHSICSICGNKAKTRQEYCDHIKYQKHKIFPDGRRVYEINIGPRFHDISAVLNGADKTAKVTGLLIMGDKVAFVDSQESEMEKAASLENALYDPKSTGFTPYYKTEEFHGNYVEEKVASLADDIGDILEHRKRYANKKEEEMQKIAEIKKRIQGRVIALANAKVGEKLHENIEDVAKLLKLFYTDYWDEDKCKEIANSIKDIAAKRGISPEDAFEHFCHTAELAGIELSSLEFDRILRHLTGENKINTEEVLKQLFEITPMSNIENILREHDNIIDEHGRGLNMPTVIKIRRVINTATPDLCAGLGKQPLSGVVRVIAKRVQPLQPAQPPFIDNDMMDILKPYIPERSYHRPHLLPRVIRIVKINKKPNFDNIMHFLLPLILKTSNLKHLPLAASALGYSAYQDGRVRLANSEEYDLGLEKFASLIFNERDLGAELAQFGEVEKQAGILGKGYTTRKALVVGLPLTYGYSAMQRARIKNGENVSGFNRYVAENPGNAYIVQALLGPRLLKKVKKLPGDIKTKAKKTKDILKKSANDDYMCLMSKEASVLDEYDKMHFDIDIFSDKIIDEKLAQHYDKQQSTAIKYATVLYASGREDVSQNVLNKFSLTQEDVNRYLKIATDCLTIEIEKKANFLSDVLVSTSQDMLFNPKGVSALALGPGNLIDGIVLTKLQKKLMEDTENKDNQKPQLPKDNNNLSKKEVK